MARRCGFIRCRTWRRLRIVHFAHSNEPIRYSACATACTIPASWRTGILVPAGGGSVTAKLDPHDVLHVTYHDAVVNLKYLQ
jgi:hypothetical protein